MKTYSMCPTVTFLTGLAGILIGLAPECRSEVDVAVDPELCKRISEFGDKFESDQFSALFEGKKDGCDPIRMYQARLIHELYGAPSKDGISGDAKLSASLSKEIAGDRPADEVIGKVYGMMVDHSYAELSRRADEGSLWAQLGMVRLHGLRMLGRRVVEKFEGTLQPPEAARDYELVKIIALGEHPGPDGKRAAALLERAVASGHPRALAAASPMIAQGVLGRADPGRARELRRKAVEAGDPLGKTLEAYQLLDSDRAASLRLLREAVKAGYAAGAWWAYQYSRMNKLGEVEESESAAWLSLAKKMECPEAILSGVHEFSVELRKDGPVEKEKLALMELFERMATLVIPAEQFPYSLAVAAKWGIGCPKSPEVATAAWMQAAKGGNAEACFEAGIANMDGIGTAKNPETAAFWLEKAARARDVRALGYLIGMAEEGVPAATAHLEKLRGERVPMDEKRATEFWASVREQRKKIEELEQNQARHEQNIKVLEKRRAELAVERQVLLDKKAALVSATGGEKWPPPDIVFASPEDWHRRMSAAPVLTKSEFMKKVRTVHIHLRTTSIVTKVLPKDDMWLMAAKAVRASGFEVDTKANVALEIGIYPRSVENITRENGNVVGRKMLSNFIVEVKFIVPARVLRNGEFLHVAVSPATAMAFRGQVGAYEAATLKREFAELFAGCINYLKEPSDAVNVDLWKPDLGPLGSAAGKFKAYTASRRDKEDEFERAFTGLKRLRTIEVNLKDDAGKFASERGLRGSWQRMLEGNGFLMDEASPVMARYSFFANYHGPENALQALVTDPARDHWAFVQYLMIRDGGAIYDLDGEPYRGMVDLTTDVTAGFALRDEGREKFNRQFDEMKDDFSREARFRR